MPQQIDRSRAGLFVLIAGCVAGAGGGATMVCVGDGGAAVGCR